MESQPARSQEFYPQLARRLHSKMFAICARKMLEMPVETLLHDESSPNVCLRALPQQIARITQHLYLFLRPIFRADRIAEM
jgi:hypothetical protein